MIPVVPIEQCDNLTVFCIHICSILTITMRRLSGLKSRQKDVVPFKLNKYDHIRRQHLRGILPPITFDYRPESELFHHCKIGTNFTRFSYPVGA